MEFQVDLAGQTWGTPLWPLLAAGSGFLLLLGLLLLTALQPRAPRADRQGELLWIGGGTLLLVLASMLAPAIAALVEALMRGGGVLALSPMRVFKPLILGETALSCAGTVVAGTTLALARFRPPPSAEIRQILLASLLPSWLACLCGAAGAALLVGTGPLPFFEDAPSPRVHVGRNLEFTPTMSGLPDPSNWEPSPIAVRPEAPGLLHPVATASKRWVSVSRVLEIEAGEPIGDPLLPLALGSSWTFVHISEYRNQFLWFFAERGKHESAPLRLEVRGRDEEGPLLVWDLGTTSQDDPIAWRVLPWNGSWRLAEDPREFFFERLDEDEPVEGPDGERLVSCHLALFPGHVCHCLAQPQGKARIPGPALCSPTGGGGSGLRALGSGLLAIMTAGLVVLDPSPRARWVLLESGGT